MSQMLRVYEGWDPLTGDGPVGGKTILGVDSPAVPMPEGAAIPPRVIVLPPGDLSYDTLDGIFENFIPDITNQVRILSFIKERLESTSFFDDIRKDWQQAVSARHRYIDEFSWDLAGDPASSMNLRGSEKDSYDGDRAEGVSISLPLATACDYDLRKQFFTKLKEQTEANRNASLLAEQARERKRKEAEFERLRKELGK